MQDFSIHAKVLTQEQTVEGSALTDGVGSVLKKQSYRKLSHVSFFNYSNPTQARTQGRGPGEGAVCLPARDFFKKPKNAIFLVAFLLGEANIKGDHSEK